MFRSAFRNGVGLVSLILTTLACLTEPADAGARGQCGQHAGSACAIDGVCVPNRLTYGFYETRWRKWPAEMMVGAESISAPTVGRDAEDMPPADVPDASDEADASSPGPGAYTDSFGTAADLPPELPDDIGLPAGQAATEDLIPTTSLPPLDQPASRETVNPELDSPGFPGTQVPRDFPSPLGQSRSDEMPTAAGVDSNPAVWDTLEASSAADLISLDAPHPNATIAPQGPPADTDAKSSQAAFPGSSVAPAPEALPAGASGAAEGGEALVRYRDAASSQDDSDGTVELPTPQPTGAGSQDGGGNPLRAGSAATGSKRRVTKASFASAQMTDMKKKSTSDGNPLRAGWATFAVKRSSDGPGPASSAVAPVVSPRRIPARTASLHGSHPSANPLRRK